jgi:hypothetical protein
LLVIDPDDNYPSSGYGYIEPRVINTNILVKYPDEYNYLKKNEFKGVLNILSQLKEGDLVKSKNNEKYYIFRKNKLLPFHNIQVLNKLGYNIANVKEFADEDLQYELETNLSIGPEITA